MFSKCNKMNNIHLEFLQKLGIKDQGYVGNNSMKWANNVLPDVFFEEILNRRFNRYELFEYCRDSKNSDLNVLIAILSWGGMRRDHGRKLLKNPILILDLVKNLRKNIYPSRKVAFTTFKNYRDRALLPGLGIGYFTKLICFLSPDLNGYIMDQWVAKSINLLTDIEIVKLTGNNWVNDDNNSDDYEIFCSRIDSLAKILNCSGFEAEEKIFSVGKGKGVWRNYLIKSYSPNFLLNK